jgi:methionyl-tRNA synthetase
MQAVFRFRGAEEIVVSNQPGGVLVEVYEGYETQCPACKKAGPGASCTGCGEVTKNQTLAQKALISLSNSEARSVASAMMGAAKA